MDRAELRRAILGADDLPTETVDVPEWGQKIRLRGLTAAEKDGYVSQVTDMGSGQIKWRNATALLVARSIVDEGGERVFSDADAKELGEKSASAIAPLFEAAMRLSKFTKEDIEESVRDFEPAQSDGSSTASR